MNTFLLMLIICLGVQRTFGSKSLFDYNINPEYDLVAEESSASYSNRWPNSHYYVVPRRRSKHHAKGREHGRHHGKRKHNLPQHAAELSDGYLYPDASEEYDYFDQPYYSPHFHHPHGLPPGQAKKHGQPYGQPYGHPYVIPPRFPPPPVYDKNFLNPWTLSATHRKPFVGQDAPLTTPRPLYEYEQHPATAPPAVYVAPKFTTTTTTQSPLSSTATDDQLMYDIDVRFGGGD